MKNMPSKRIVALDLMRGYFIFVVLADHLLRWPSPFSWITGSGRLWVSAAEGFFIISGILVGYTKGFKKQDRSMKETTMSLIKRALILYTTLVISSVTLVLIAGNLSYPQQLQPTLPTYNNVFQLILKIVSLNFVFEWVYFLKLYVFALLFSPIFILLLKKKRLAIYITLTVLLWYIGILVKKDWLQWQLLFFIPAILGYNLEYLRGRWSQTSRSYKKIVIYLILTTFLTTLLLSIFWVLGWEVAKSEHILPSLTFEKYVEFRKWIDPIFSKSPLSPSRIMLSFIWFSGIFIIFRKFETWLNKYLGWLLMSLGAQSLRAYTISAYILVFIQSVIPVSLSSTINSIVIISTVTIVVLLLKFKPLQKIIPT
jgi:hypothetical protein